MRLALLLLLIAPAVALAQAGRFLLAAGEVAVIRAGKETRAAAGTALEPGDTIRVGPRSSVQLRMSDRQIIALRSNTVFRIDEYSYSGRGDESDRSFFSLVRGGMRTVGGAIARRQSEDFLRTSARPDALSGPQPAAEEKKPRDESEAKAVDRIKAPLRTVAGALTPTRHAVRVPTATIGVRGTHYTLVHCDNDCFETRRTSVASALLAQSDAGTPGIGSQAPNGTYGGISDGLVAVVNNRDDRQFGANSFFYVASADSPIQSLIGPPAFLYDRLEAQERNRGLRPAESTVTMERSGVNAESRPSDTPVPPALPTFVVTESRSASGALAVVPGAPAGPTVPPLPAPSTAFLSAFTNATGGPDTVGAFVDASQLTSPGTGAPQLDAFSVPAAALVNPAAGPYSGTSMTGSVVSETVPNALNAYWGTWSAGAVADANGTTVIDRLSLPTNVFHYLVGPNTPPEVIAAKDGTIPFQMVGGTLPQNNLGETAISFTGTTLTVDFTARAVTFPATQVDFVTQSWSFPTSTSPIVIEAGRGASVSNTVAGSCGPITGCSGTALLDRTGIFMGPAGDHLGVAHQARTTSGTPASFQTTKIFSCAPSC